MRVFDPQDVMKEFPESEIQTKMFADAGEKRSENLAKNFADFHPLISRKSGCKTFHEKSSTFFTRDETKFFHREILGRGCPNKMSSLLIFPILAWGPCESQRKPLSCAQFSRTLWVFP